MLRPELEEDKLYELNSSIKVKRQTHIDNSFIMRKRGLIMNPAYRKFMGGKIIVYEYLWANIIRKYDKSDAFHIREKYFERGFLACCLSYRQIAAKCFMSLNTVRRYIKEFKKAGIIFIHTMDKSHSVFELGRWKDSSTPDGRPLEFYYIDDIFYI